MLLTDSEEDNIMDALKLLYILLACVGLITISLLYYADTLHHSQDLTAPIFQVGGWGIIQLIAQCIGVTVTLASPTVDDRQTTILALHIQVALGEYLDLDWVVLTVTWQAPGRDLQIGGPSHPTAQTGSVTLQVLNSIFYYSIIGWDYPLIQS